MFELQFHAAKAHPAYKPRRSCDGMSAKAEKCGCQSTTVMARRLPERELGQKEGVVIKC